MNKLFIFLTITLSILMASLCQADTVVYRDQRACSVMTGTGGASTLNVGLSNCYTFTVTDNEDTTITFSSAGTFGDEIMIIFYTAGTADEVITFHNTLANVTGTLTLGTTAARWYVIKFWSDGTQWYEVSRTAVLT